MDLANNFATFLSEIRLTKNQKDDLRRGHTVLRERLQEDEKLCKIIVTDFLQGSYRRATAVRPKGDKRADVDIIVVTKLSETEYTPEKAMQEFHPFLDKYYEGKWRTQGRSFGIELSYVDMDLVITSAPSEAEHGILKSDALSSDEDMEEAPDWALKKSWVSLAKRKILPNASVLMEAAASEEEWKASPLRIPDTNTKRWEETHPLEQMRWTKNKNSLTNKNFVNVVKALKWWRLEKHETPEKPKGFPLERLIGECCPDGISSVASGIVLALESIVTKYSIHAATGQKPFLPDYGVPLHDVFKRVSAEDFKQFYEQVKAASKLARRALDSEDRTESGNLWRELLGEKFPAPPDDGSGGGKGFTEPKGPTIVSSGRFA